MIICDVRYRYMMVHAQSFDGILDCSKIGYPKLSQINGFISFIMVYHHFESAISVVFAHLGTTQKQFIFFRAPSWDFDFPILLKTGKP